MDVLNLNSFLHQKIKALKIKSLLSFLQFPTLRNVPELSKAQK